MRAVIIGTDFIYDKNGNLKPIEINTNIGIAKNRIEDESVIFDMTEFQNFVAQKGFTKVTYIGAIFEIKNEISKVCGNLSVEFDHILVGSAALTIPYVEDTNDHLIIRTSYDTTALLDETYCKDKVNYLNLIKDSDFGSQFAYVDENNQLVNYITEIKDNGPHPNFIIKAKEPYYDRGDFPKFYKVTTQEQLNTLLGQLNKDLFLMEFHINTSKVYDGLVTKIRKISLFYPPNLETIHLGSYTDLTTQRLSQNITYDPNTFELDYSLRNSYITANLYFREPKLLDTDYVILADGTRKSGADLQVGDILKTIDIPNSTNVDISNELTNYHIDIDTFVSGATYSTNAVIAKTKVDVMTKIYTITFTDDTTWSDTELSSYLVESAGEVRFKYVSDLDPGDILILIDTSDENNVITIKKTVDSIASTSEIFSGYIIGVERAHLFLTQTSDLTSMVYSSFVAVEHNLACSGGSCYVSTPYNMCNKGVCCCAGRCKICISL